MTSYKDTNLYKLIKQEINKIDVYGLLNSGCPEDEFETEINLIYAKIKRGMNSKQIESIIATVFTNMFNEDFNPEYFENVSNKIERELNKN